MTVTIDELQAQLPQGRLEVGVGLRRVERGQGSTISELFTAFHYAPIQLKGACGSTRTNVLLTGKELVGIDWELYDTSSL